MAITWQNILKVSNIRETMKPINNNQGTGLDTMLLHIPSIVNQWKLHFSSLYPSYAYFLGNTCIFSVGPVRLLLSVVIIRIIIETLLKRNPELASWPKFPLNWFNGASVVVARKAVYSRKNGNLCACVRCLRVVKKIILGTTSSGKRSSVYILYLDMQKLKLGGTCLPLPIHFVK